MILGEEVSFLVPETEDIYYVNNIYSEGGWILGFGVYKLDGQKKKPIAVFYDRTDMKHLCVTFHNGCETKYDLIPILKSNINTPYDELIRKLKIQNQNLLYRIIRAHGEGGKYLIVVNDYYELTVYHNDFLGYFAPLVSISCGGKENVMKYIETVYNENYRIKKDERY